MENLFTQKIKNKEFETNLKFFDSKGFDFNDNKESVLRERGDYLIFFC